MKVALITPSIKGHELRGTGVYTESLATALVTHTPVSLLTADMNHLPSDVDLYHFTYFDPFFLTLPKVNKPVIVTIHDLIPLHFSKYFPSGIKGTLKWHLQRLSARQADAIITDSQASKADIIRYIGKKATDIYPIYLAPDVLFAQDVSEIAKKALQKKYRLPPQFVLAVGEPNWNKNYPRLIAAMQKTNFPLVIVSKSLAYASADQKHVGNESWLQAAQLLSTASRIIVIGPVPKTELVTLYQSSTMLLFPSLYEGFGLPVVEAFASGCPVITSNRGSISELVGEAALVVDPENEQNIAQGVMTLWQNTKMRQDYIKKGYRQVKKFTWQKTAQATYSVYEKIVGK